MLGVFTATFVYSLLVMRSVRGTGDDVFVPVLSVTLAVALALTSIGVLIFFIHHVSVSIQADEVVAAVSGEVNESIQRLFPEGLGDPQAEAGREAGAQGPPRHDGEAAVLRGPHDGYVEAIDTGLLMALAQAHDLLLDLKVRPGAFVDGSTPILCAWPRGRVADGLDAKLARAFVVGSHRTLTQDAEYGLHQLVEIAVRALSPGINDPFTALSCLDRLGAALCRLTDRRFPSAARYDEQGNLRVIAEVTSFRGFADAAFDLIRQNASSTPTVLIAMLDTVNRVAERAQTPEQRAVLREHARRIRDLGLHEFTQAGDRAALEERYQRSLILAGGDPSTRGPQARWA